MVQFRIRPAAEGRDRGVCIPRRLGRREQGGGSVVCCAAAGVRRGWGGGGASIVVGVARVVWIGMVVVGFIFGGGFYFHPWRRRGGVWVTVQG